MGNSSCRCVARRMIGYIFRNQRSQRIFRVMTGPHPQRYSYGQKKACYPCVVFGRLE
jgi:hypothetical protein